MTNAERIRAMTDEELSLYLCGIFSTGYGCYKYCPVGYMCCCCHNGMEEWLKQEAKD